jgi:hypothetical protein
MEKERNDSDEPGDYADGQDSLLSGHVSSDPQRHKSGFWAATHKYPGFDCCAQAFLPVWFHPNILPDFEKDESFDQDRDWDEMPLM